MKKRILSMILALAMVLSLGLSVVAEGEETQADIVDAAFALATGASLEGNKTLTGEVSQIITEYSSEYENVSLNIIVFDGNGDERTLYCYRMKGDDAATVEVGDTITVTGKIKNYKGTVEFDSGCTFVTVSKAGGDYAIKTFAGYASGDVAILVRQEGKTTVSDVTGGKDYNAYALIVCNADGKVIDLDLRGPGRPAGVKGDYEIPADGFIIGINRDVSGYPIHVGTVDGAEAFIADGVELGSRIKLYGIDLSALAATAAQTVLVEGASFSIFPRLPETEEEILTAAFALEPGEVLEGTYSLTGVVTEKIDDNRQVKITVADHEILCYKMVEADYNAISVDDTVTVTGVLKNYQGTVEFDTGCTAVIVPMPLFDWDEDAWVDAVIGENAGWQNPDYAPADDADPETVLAPKFQYRIEDGYFYAAALFNLPLTKGTGNGNSTFFRVWVKTAEDQLSYRYFYEVYVKTDDTLGFRAADNINGTTAGTNSPTNNTESAYSYNMIETADGVLAEIRIPLEEIGATDYLAAYLTASIEKVTGGAVQNQCLYFPALGDAHITSGTWTEEHGNIGLVLIAPVEPITEQIVDLEEVKILDVITFTADDPSIGTVRISGSYDGEEYYDLNNNGNVNVNADTGVATVNLNTQGYIQVRYLKVTGTDVHGTLTATYKNADEGAFIAPPYGPYDFGPKDGNPYCIVMLENRVVDINAVAGDDYAVSVKNNQLIITQKVANGVYKIIANSVNAWPSQGHPELITAGIEGLDIDEEGIITLAEDQFAFVIVSSGSIKTAGDEQTAPAKRIDRGLGVNGYWRVDGDKVTLHVNQPEPVEEPEPEPYEATVIVADNAILTDGETGFQGAWGTVGTGDVLLVSNPQCTTVPMIVTIIDELDEITEISKVILDLYHDANVMIGYPEGKAAVSVSADGETYTDIGEFDLVAADLGTGNHGTVSNVFEFEATEAKFVKIVLNVGSNAAVLGDSPADGKVNWEFIAIAEVAVESDEEPAPEPGKYEIKSFAGYVSGDVAILVRQEGKTTVSDVTGGKDYNAYALIICDGDGNVTALDLRGPGRPAGVKGDVEVPEGGFIIAINRDVADYPIHVGSVDGAEAFIADGVAVGDEIELIGVDLEALATAAAQTALTGASFNLVHYDEIPEGATEITHFANYGTNVSSVFFRIGEAKTIGEVIEITYGTVKNFAWSNAMVVDADGKIIEIVPDGQNADKTNLEIPEGGFIITGHGSSAAYTTIAGALVGGTVELINVDEEALVDGAVAVALKNAAFTYAEPEVERPISYQKPYTVAKANGAATYWSNTAGTVTLDDDGVIITDGKYGSLAGDTKGNYVALNQLASGAGIFVVDLGENYYVDKFDVHTAANTGWGIPQGKYIVVSYSTDGENFTQAGIIEGDGEIYSGTGSGWTAYYQELQLDKSVSARYVKFEVTTWGNFLWISEVEVWEGEEPEPMGDTTIDGVFDDDIWEGVEWTTYDGYTKGTWQQYHKKGTYTYKTAIAEDDEYFYFAGEVSCLNVTQIRLWFRTNPEASLYTHFVDVFSDGRNLIKKNQSLTENSGAELENKPVYALVELEGKTYVEIKVAKSDLDMDGDYDFIPQASVDGFSNLLGAEIIHGNFVYGGKTMTYFPWVGWPAAPEETYIGLIPVTNHWTFTDITSGDTVGVINKAHYERQADGSLRFVVGGTALYPLVSYNYEEAKVYDVARGTLNYKFTTDRHNTNITFIFEDANGAPYSFPLANSAAGFAEGQYNAGTGDILPGTYEGSIALADLVASTSLYGNNPFPEADATELKFIGIQIYACGITDPAGGVYIDDLSVTEEAAPEVNENVMDLGEVVTITGVTFTADNPDGLETVEILGSIDGVNYYRLNSEPAVTVTDGVATVNFAMANNNFRAFLNIRYIKVVGAPNVEGEIDIIEAAEEDVVKGIAPQGPYTQTGLNTNGYGIVVWTAEDAPEGFGLNDKGVYTDHDKALNLNSCMITIAEEVDEGVYKILWNDSNGWSKETGAAHLNTPEGVEGVDYRDGKVYLGENQIAMFIMSSGGYNTAGDGEFATAKWILRGIVEGGYLRFGDETVEFFNEQPAAAASQEELSIADFDGDGDIDSDDAIYLLRAVLFPEDYEITLATPFYGDGNPTSDDAIYLLRHVLFPKDYPLPLE